jgi:hypothetical protein
VQSLRQRSCPLELHLPEPCSTRPFRHCRHLGGVASFADSFIRAITMENFWPQELHDGETGVFSAASQRRARLHEAPATAPLHRRL